MYAYYHIDLGRPEGGKLGAGALRNIFLATQHVHTCHSYNMYRQWIYMSTSNSTIKLLSYQCTDIGCIVVSTVLLPQIFSFSRFRSLICSYPLVVSWRVSFPPSGRYTGLLTMEQVICHGYICLLLLHPVLMGSRMMENLMRMKLLVTIYLQMIIVM